MRRKPVPVKSISRPDTEEINVIEAAFDFSRNGIAAFTRPYRMHHVDAKSGLPSCLIIPHGKGGNIADNYIDSSQRTPQNL